MARNETRIEQRGTAAIVASLSAALVYAWIAAGFHPFTWPMRTAVLIPIALALLIAWNAPRDMGERAVDRAAGFIVWVTLFVLLVAWELLALFQSPRGDHPTLSSMSDDVMSVHAGRAFMFAVWLASGWVLFLWSRASVR